MPLSFVLSLVAATPMTTVLENGLTVIIDRDTRGRRAALVMRYDAGHLDDPPGMPELAHLTEHFAFRLDREDDGQFAETYRLLDETGAVFNGLTYEDATVYFVASDVAHLEQWIWLEFRRMTQASFPSREAHHDTRVVHAELLRRGRRRWLEQVFEALLWRPNRRRPTLQARLNSVEQLSSRHIEWFHRTHYRPRSARLVIVSPLEVERVLKLVRRYFDPIRDPEPREPRMARPVEAAPPCPAQRLMLKSNTPENFAAVAWRGDPSTPQRVADAGAYVVKQRLEQSWASRDPEVSVAVGARGEWRVKILISEEGDARDVFDGVDDDVAASLGPVREAELDGFKEMEEWTDERARADKLAWAQRLASGKGPARTANASEVGAVFAAMTDAERIVVVHESRPRLERPSIFGAKECR